MKEKLFYALFLQNLPSDSAKNKKSSFKLKDLTGCLGDRGKFKCTAHLYQKVGRASTLT